MFGALKTALLMKKIILIAGLCVGILLLAISILLFIRWRKQSRSFVDPETGAGANEQLLVKEKGFEDRPTAKQDNERINKIT